MSYHCGGTMASCCDYVSMPQPLPVCVWPKHKTQPMAKDFKLSKKPLLDYLETDRLMKIQLGMENSAYQRKIHDNAKFKMKLAFADAQIDLENRRDKLKVLLENENTCFRQEIIDKFETKGASRIDEMREKVKKLREEKESLHKKVVEEKLDLVFQSQCAELRPMLSKRLDREIAEDLKEQMREKRRLECEAQEEERMWACLNLMDMDAKDKREQAYQDRRIAFAETALAETSIQMEYKKAKKANLAKIAEREREMIEADILAVAAEKQKRVALKAAKFERNKAHMKEMLETRNYYRERKLKREEIVAMEFLKKAVRELYIEQEDRNKRKRDLMKAITIYRDYLEKWNCLENSREDALQRIIDGVIEEQHEKVMASRKREHEQRRKLFENVLAGRQLQIEDLERKRVFEESQYQKEMEMLKADWKEYLREEAQEKAERLKKTWQYKSDLDCQVAYNTLLKDRELKEFERQDQMGTIEEKLFNHRLQTTVKESQLARSNPYRLPLIGKAVRQVYCPV